MTKLIEKGVFTDGGAEEKALKFKRELLDRQSKAQEENEMKAKARKAKVKRDSCQKTLHSMFKKSQEATTVMEDSSSSVSDSSDLGEL